MPNAYERNINIFYRLGREKSLLSNEFEFVRIMIILHL